MFAFVVGYLFIVTGSGNCYWLHAYFFCYLSCCCHSAVVVVAALPGSRPRTTSLPPRRRRPASSPPLKSGQASLAAIGIEVKNLLPYVTVMYRYGITYRTCLLDDWFFVVQLKPLEEHLVSNVLVARSSRTGAQCHLCNLCTLQYIFSKLFVFVM